MIITQGECKNNMSDTEARYYDREEIWEGYRTSGYERERALATVGLIPADAHCVLDVGCGNGLLTNIVERPRVLGLDFVRTPLKTISRDALQASIAAIPVKAGKVDIVIAAEVLEHLDDGLFAGAIEEIKRLEPRYILISVPYSQCLEEGLCKCSDCGRTFHVAHHLRSFDDEAVEKLFEGYVAASKRYTGKATMPSGLLNRVRRKLDLHYYSDSTICDQCGGKPAKNNPALAIALSAFTIPYYSVLKKRLLGIYQPTHQIILLKKRQ